jgi:hypothetical protein
MAASDWGLCKECQWWQIEPEASLADTTMGLCIEEQLQPFQLRVAGNSGCNRYTPGQPARAAGSGATPPTASPDHRLRGKRISDVLRSALIAHAPSGRAPSLPASPTP